MSETIINKQCRKCKQIKSLSEFYINPKMLDNHLNICKTCYLKQIRKYQKTNKGKATHKRYKQSEKGKTTFRIAIKRWAIHHPNQIKAYNATNHAVRDGKLPRPNTLLCYYCPKSAQQYHHWHGYEKEHWLDVIPVCIKRHVLSSSLELVLE